MATQNTTIDATTVSTTATDGGKTTIVDPVIAKIAGIAAREIPGVYALGGGAERVFGSIREAVGQKDLGQGVRVEVGETEVAVDVTIVVEYPNPLHEVAADVRSAIASAITDLAGMKVAEINVTVTDVHIPGDDDDHADTEPRVK